MGELSGLIFVKPKGPSGPKRSEKKSSNELDQELFVLQFTHTVLYNSSHNSFQLFCAYQSINA